VFELVTSFIILSIATAHSLIHTLMHCVMLNTVYACLRTVTKN